MFQKPCATCLGAPPPRRAGAAMAIFMAASGEKGPPARMYAASGGGLADRRPAGPGLTLGLVTHCDRDLDDDEGFLGIFKASEARNTLIRRVTQMIHPCARHFLKH